MDDASMQIIPDRSLSLWGEDDVFDQMILDAFGGGWSSVFIVFGSAELS